MSFPALIGGTPFPDDFVPSIFFAVLYGLLIPMVLYRAINKESRTILLIVTMLFTLERVALFSFRAVLSHNESLATEMFLVTYMQNTFSIGFISIAGNLANILRCLLVNPTYGSETYGGSPAAKSSHTSLTHVHTGDFPGCPLAGTPDHPRRRFWARRFTDLIGFGFFSAIASGINANFKYSQAITSQKNGGMVTFFRYSSAATALSLMVLLALAAVWAHINLLRVSRRGVSLVIFLSCLLSVIAVYRLSVMFHTTTSLLSTETGSLNSRGAKAGFYILHVFPEWLTMSVLYGFNIRQMFGTGIYGDWRFRDETLEGRKKRERKEAEQALRRARKVSEP